MSSTSYFPSLSPYFEWCIFIGCVPSSLHLISSAWLAHFSDWPGCESVVSPAVKWETMQGGTRGDGQGSACEPESKSWVKSGPTVPSGCGCSYRSRVWKVGAPSARREGWLHGWFSDWQTDWPAGWLTSEQAEQGEWGFTGPRFCQRALMRLWGPPTAWMSNKSCTAGCHGHPLLPPQHLHLGNGEGMRKRRAKRGEDDDRRREERELRETLRESKEDLTCRNGFW